MININKTSTFLSCTSISLNMKKRSCYFENGVIVPIGDHIGPIQLANCCVACVPRGVPRLWLTPGKRAAGNIAK